MTYTDIHTHIHIYTHIHAHTPEGLCIEGSKGNDLYIHTYTYTHAYTRIHPRVYV